MMNYIKKLYQWSIYAISILAVVMMMVGGLQWMLAAGNKSKIDQAKSRISDSLMGLVLALASYLILFYINPDILTLKLPGIEKVLRIEQEATETRAGAFAGKKVISSDIQ